MIDQNDPRLTAYLLDELSQHDQAAVEAALAASPELRTQVADLQATIARMQVAFTTQNHDQPQMTDKQLQQLVAAAASGPLLTGTVGKKESSCSLSPGTPGERESFGPLSPGTPGERVGVRGYTTVESVTRLRWRNLALAALVLYAVGLTWFAFREPLRTVSAINETNQQTVSNHPLSTTDEPIVIEAAPAVENTIDEVTKSMEIEANRVRLMVNDPIEVRQELAQQSPPEIGAYTVNHNAPSPVDRMAGGKDGGMDGGMGNGRLQSMGTMGRRMMTTTEDVSGQMSTAPELLDSMMSTMQMPQDLSTSNVTNWHFDREQDAVDRVSRFHTVMPTERGAAAFSDEVIGDTQLQPVPELGMIILRGSNADTQRVAAEREKLEATQEVDAPHSVEASVAAIVKPKTAIQPAEEEQLKRVEAPTWKPASAATNRARLSVGHHDDLNLVARDTYVRIDGFRARVFFDCYYYNDRPQQLEGQFMLRLPDDASLHYFAFGPATLPSLPPAVPTNKPGDAVQVSLSAATAAVQSLREQTANVGSDLARRATDSNYAPEADSTFGLVKSARVAPRQQAALAYDETVRRRVDPALVEWAGPGIFQTRVFPLMPNQLHRIIIGYDVNLRDDGSDRVYTLPLPEGDAGGRVEFDIAASAGTQVTINPATDAFVSGGRAYYRFEHADARDYTVRLAGTESVVLNSGNASDAYFATRVIAKLPEAVMESDSRQAVFLLDTSWSDRPAAFSQRLKLLAQVLEQNRDTIEQFAVLLFNVEQRWWRTEFVKNDADNVAVFINDSNQLALEGATDLHAALSEATHPSWATPHDASAPQPNFFLLSDAAATWGKTDLASMSDPLARLDRTAGGGALFAYHLLGQRSDKALLEWLTQATGGAVFDVSDQVELAKVAVAHRSRPWQIVAATATSANEILIQGLSKTVYPNQPLVIAGRGRIEGPLRIDFQRGTQRQSLEFELKVPITSPAAARLYGQLAVERLEPYADELEAVTVAFARYFRVPGRTCSLVMLDSQDDYQRLGVNVPPEEDQLVIASTSVTTTIEEQELKGLQQREQPRQQFLAWVDSLQASSLLNVSTALRLAMQRLPETAFRFDAKRLDCHSWKSEQLSNGFKTELEHDEPGFDAVMEEAERKLIAFGAGDALKTASTAVEAKPADVDTLRSVAFRAIQWQRSDQAAPLLWRLAKARPYQPQCLLLLARAMSESGDIDGAIVCYDLVSSGKWNERWAGARQIAEVELLSVLEQVHSGQLKSAMGQYAEARLQQLRSRWSQQGIDMVVIMHWNTDRTDVDLHVTEPNGEECFYSHNRTAAGGRLTQDITEGLGPEMYSLETALAGQYKVEAKYYATDANRTQAPTEILLTILQNVGKTDWQSQTKRVTLTGSGEKQVVFSVNR